MTVLNTSNTEVSVEFNTLLRVSIMKCRLSNKISVCKYRGSDLQNAKILEFNNFQEVREAFTTPRMCEIIDLAEKSFK